MPYKSIIIEKFGGPEVLKTIESDLPEPKAGEVRVKILHASANFTDIMIRKGKYPDVKEKPPFTLGYDMVGRVDKTGEGVTKFKPGDLVTDMTVTGSYAEYICLPEKQLVPVPEAVNPAEAVTLILSYMTAYQMLHRVANIKQGQRILVHGAGGAVGSALLQLGKLLDLDMYGTASGSKQETVEQNGAFYINYQKENFVHRIKTLTHEGVDAVFDPIGGKHFNRSFQCLRNKGKLVAYGFYNAVMGKGGNIPIDFMKLMLWNILPNNKKTSFYSIGAMRKKHPEWFKNDLQTLFGLLAKGKIHPVIAAHYPLEKVKEVHNLIENTAVKGKIIFDP